MSNIQGNSEMLRYSGNNVMNSQGEEINTEKHKKKADSPDKPLTKADKFALKKLTISLYVVFLQDYNGIIWQ